MNKTKCRVCGKELTIPYHMDPDYEKAQKITGEIEHVLGKLRYKLKLGLEIGDFVFLECTRTRYFGNPKRPFDACWNPAMGGYYCHACFYKIAEKERKAEEEAEDPGFDEELGDLVRCGCSDREYSMCYGCWFGLGDGVEWECEHFEEMIKEYNKQKKLKEEREKRCIKI